MKIGNLPPEHNLVRYGGFFIICHFGYHTRMWTCRSCNAFCTLQTAKATLDAQGLNFICPICQHRNVLINVGGITHLHVVQPDIDWDEFKARS